MVDPLPGTTRSVDRQGRPVCIGIRLLWAIMFLILTGLPVHAQVLRQLTDTPTEFVGDYAVDDSGNLVVAVTSEVTSTNQGNRVRAVGWDLLGGSRFDIVPFSVCCDLTVSDDGQWTAFVSAADPLGQNPDGGDDVFLASIDGVTIRQLTNRPAGDSRLDPLLSGSGNRVLYMDTTDPLGTNPGGLPQLFLVGADGAGLTQLTTITNADAGFCGFTISDDGGRISFASTDDPSGMCQLFRVDPDGSNLVQLTTGALSSGRPKLAGDGSWIAYTALDSSDSTYSVSAIQWPGGAPSSLIEGFVGSITDDGQWIYYSADDASNTDQLYKIPITGGAATQLSFNPPGNVLGVPIVSGADARVVFKSISGEYPGADNPDGSQELLTIHTDGTGVRQLTDLEPTAIHWEPDITTDGRRVVFGKGQIILSAYEDFNLHVMSTDDATSTALTMDADIYYPSITGDGRTIAFVSGTDLIGDDPSNDFRVYRIRSDGSDLARLTPAAYTLESYSVVAKTAGDVVFYSILSGVAGVPLFKVSIDGGPISQVTDDEDGRRKNPRVDYAGQWVTYHSGADPFGTNPDLSFEVFRVRTDGTGLQQVTDMGATLPDLSADGGLVVYESSGDPLGLNADGNQEIFLFHAGTDSTQQLTVTDAGENSEPRISGNGDYVYWRSTSAFFEPVSDGKQTLYRIELGSGRIERANGLPDARSKGFFSGTLRNNPAVAVDETGDRAVFVGDLNGVRRNDDLNSEVFFVDFSGLPDFEPSASTPTVVRWEADPRGVSYDVLRGDLASLQAGDGDTVNLGTVVCLENDSTDTTTVGFEDPEQPEPGEVFWFLYRWTQGTLDGPGSWGQGSGGAERVAETGACVDLAP